MFLDSEALELQTALDPGLDIFKSSTFGMQLSVVDLVGAQRGLGGC